MGKPFLECRAQSSVLWHLDLRKSRNRPGAGKHCCTCFISRATVWQWACPLRLWALRSQPQLPLCQFWSIAPLSWASGSLLTKQGNALSPVSHLGKPVLVPEETCSKPSSTIFLGQWIAPHQASVFIYKTGTASSQS